MTANFNVCEPGQCRMREDKRVAKLVEALEAIVKTDADYSTRSKGVSRLKHCVAVAQEALAKFKKAKVRE